MDCHAPSKRLPLPTVVSRIRSSFVMAAMVWVCTSTGCVTARYLQDRPIRANALESSLQLLGRKGPEISSRTQHTLRRYGLSDTYQMDSNGCIGKLRTLNRQNLDPELTYAVAELAYVEGKIAERSGETSTAMNHYGIALTTSYRYLFGQQLSDVRNEYDPQFRAVCDLYNESLEDLLRVLCAENQLRPGHTYTIQTADRKFIIRTEMRGGWQPDEFDRYEFVSDFDIKTLRNRHTTFGLGVPLIAVRKPRGGEDTREDYYPEGLSYAVTALLRCSTEGDIGPGYAGSGDLLPDAQSSVRLASHHVPQITPVSDDPNETPVCVLEFFDPLRANQIKLGGDWVPLETDLTTPLAYFLDSPEYRKRDRATEGLLDPDDAQQKRGLYMLEPYDPNRIPVLMVHGLWSSPLTWMDMFNDLRSFPEVRERYQFWFYLYPSGQPFWLSATQLRSDLFAMRQTFDPTGRDRAVDNMVLVGHSMGGLVSRMQTIDSGDDFWNLVSNQPKEKLRGPPQDVNKLVSALEFRPNQSISRVITIGTPHRGSDLANSATRWLAGKIIKLPKMALSTSTRLIRANPNFFRDTRLLTEANAVDSLAPDSPIFPVLLRAKTSPEIRYHNIIGVLHDPPMLAGRNYKGDGVVEYASAKMEDVKSELVVDATHTSLHMTGKSIFEVRRILLEHLEEVDSEDRLAWAAPNRTPLVADGAAGLISDPRFRYEKSSAFQVSEAVRDEPALR
ncbi:Alpha/beta hydrolase family protein [Allorhodopirellula heiligendammensis]|uniref:Alpha/beta hydrolase family protein n=2 Tax=Allorhodopirellula heiligendammensis TaxID=2714739 RepID=A0A5C6BDR8_9BACT|nr:Alpha/beta hydrolase family protein [Allorhodopirellula heiligendammensis]